VRTAATILIISTVLAGASWGADAGDKVYISEVLYEAGTNSPPPFIELYNANRNDNVSLAGWKVRLATKSGAEEVTLPEEAVIPYCGFYLIGRAQDRTAWAKFSYRPDFYCDLSMDYLKGKGGVILFRANGETRDGVGWGAAPWPFYEGTPHLGVAAGHSMERKSGPTHNEINGNSYDTGVNLNDFRDRSNPQPQNIKSYREYPAANTTDNAWGRIKAMYYSR
jgi:hypothetical protein